MSAGVLKCMCDLHNCRRELVARVRALRIHRMLAHLGLSLRRYLRKARPLDVERQLLVCQHCGMKDTCDDCLQRGKDIKEGTFCPNFPKLLRYRPLWRTITERHRRECPGPQQPST
jgi:hypothetical protein